MVLNWITIATVATLLLCDYSHSKTIMLFYKDSSEEQTQPQNVMNIYTNSLILSAKDAFGSMSDKNLESGVKIQPFEDANNQDTNNAEDADYEAPNNDARGEVNPSYDYTDNEVQIDEHTNDEIRSEEDELCTISSCKETDTHDYNDLYSDNEDADNEVPNNEDTDNETPKNEDAKSEVSNDEDVENEAPHNEDAHNAEVEILKYGNYNGYGSPAFRDAYGTIRFTPYWAAYAKPNIQNLEEKDEYKSQDHSEEHPKESDESDKSTDEFSVPEDLVQPDYVPNYEPSNDSDEDDKSTVYTNNNEFPNHNSQEALYRGIVNWGPKTVEKSQEPSEENLSGLQYLFSDEDDKSTVNNNNNEFQALNSEEEYHWIAPGVRTYRMYHFGGY